MTQGRAYQPSEPDRQFVERAVMAGTTINNIADALNVSDDTLRKYYRYEIVTARERMKGEAIRVLMDSLTDGSLDAAKYVLSRVAGWTERQDVVSSDGSMSPKATRIDLSKLSNQALEEIIAAGDENPKD